MEKVEKKETAEEHVSRAEFAEFARVVHEGLDEIRKDIEALRCEAAEPKAVGIYDCHEKGCEFVTDDFGAFVDHKIDERLGKLSSTAPQETST